MEFLIVVGSTRENRKSIYAAEKLGELLQTKNHSSTLFDLKEKEIPFLGNRSYTDEGPVPQDIQEFSKLVEKADGVIIVTPEYNHSIPGVLKNALDYLYPEYDDKPFSYMTTSAGGFGGIRALSHLHDITLALGGFPGPSIQVSRIGKILEDGELKDDEVESRINSFIEDSEEHVKKLH